MAKGDILLHKEHGVNPRVTVCEDCGVDIGVIMLGIREWKGRCEPCNTNAYGVGKRGTKCAMCGEYLTDCVKIERNETVPVGHCKSCETKRDALQKELREVIDGGGIHFKCDECGARGAIRKSPPVDAVRAEALEKGKIPNIDAEFGIQLASCVEHGGGIPGEVH